MRSTRKHKRKTNMSAQGFTLFEVMFSVVIVGIAIVSLMMLFAAGTTVNAFGNDLSTGVFLADQIRAMTDQESFDNLIAAGNGTFNGVDAGGNAVAGLENYQQQLTIQSVNPEDMTVYVGPDPQAAVLTVVVIYAGKELTRISWLRVK